jgi:glycosyltransferase involved in cell wall biosynthesis
VKKKILFVFPTLGVGGTTVSVRNMVSLLEKDGYKCFVMPLYPHGTLQQLYDNVCFIKTPLVIQALGINSWKNEKKILKKILFIILRLLRNTFKGFESKVIELSLEKTIKENHIDTIVACQDGITTKFVSYEKIIPKVAWVRCDYKKKISNYKRKRERHYDGFTDIVCVSEHTCENFKSVFPEFVNKTHCIENPQDESLIRNRADLIEEEPRFIKKGKTIVSIGRLAEIKQFDKIAPIARKLLDNGIQFRWYLIGEGRERQHILDTIQKYEVGNNVIMLGAKTNPYYYIKRADVLICLSRSEACPRVINEAKILHTPTISTDFPSIYEFIQNGETGMISSLENISTCIYDLFNDNRLYATLKENINFFNFDNTKLMNKIEGIL